MALCPLKSTQPRQGKGDPHSSQDTQEDLSEIRKLLLRQSEQWAENTTAWSRLRRPIWLLFLYGGPNDELKTLRDYCLSLRQFKKQGRNQKAYTSHSKKYLRFLDGQKELNWLWKTCTAGPCSEQVSLYTSKNLLCNTVPFKEKTVNSQVLQRPLWPQGSTDLAPLENYLYCTTDTRTTHICPLAFPKQAECLLGGVWLIRSCIYSASQQAPNIFLPCMNANWKWFYNTTTGYISHIPTTTHLQNKNI